MRVRQWWSGHADVERFDLFTRWPLYLMSASEPLILLLQLGAHDRVRVAGAALLFTVGVAHTVACVTLLRAGIEHVRGGSRPPRRLVGLAAALTAAGLAAGVAAFPQFAGPAPAGVEGWFPIGLATATLFGVALTAALTPVLTVGQLVGAVVAPAAVAGGVQYATTGTGGQPLWALLYVSWAGAAVLTYRISVWYLGVVWEIDRSRKAQALLAVAEERLRFARDLHDVLGRNLALIAVNSELAAELARRGRDGAVERMLEVRQIAQDSMREVREVAAGSRRADLADELAGARSVLRSAGITARLIGDGAGLPRTAQTALGWVVREATTNILRHSNASTALIELDVAPGPDGPAAALRVENDGATRAGTGTEGAGTGLTGLRERLAGLGGDLATEAGPGGRFVVRARVPLREAQLSRGAAEPSS